MLQKVKVYNITGNKIIQQKITGIFKRTRCLPRHDSVGQSSDSSSIPTHLFPP